MKKRLIYVADTLWRLGYLIREYFRDSLDRAPAGKPSRQYYWRFILNDRIHSRHAGLPSLRPKQPNDDEYDYL